MEFVWGVFVVILFFYAVKKAIADSNLSAKIVLSLFIIILGSLILRLITGNIFFTTFAKGCACVLVVFWVISRIVKLFSNSG